VILAEYLQAMLVLGICPGRGSSEHCRGVADLFRAGRRSDDGAWNASVLLQAVLSPARAEWMLCAPGVCCRHIQLHSVSSRSVCISR